MVGRIALTFGVVSIATLVTAEASQARRLVGPDNPVIAHEWGTFTTVAGQDGRAIEWLPLNGPTDLPCFVEHFQNTGILKILPGEDARLVDYQTARSHLWGKVRMETPVLYFYGPSETVLRVQVDFPRGLITEWYPHATAAQYAVTATALRNPQFTSSIVWPRVTMSPAAGRAFPSENATSHYYAARETDASPLEAGPQREKFLFYRGVANFDVPMSARVTATGAITVRNLGSENLPGVVLFERRDRSIGFRVIGAIRDSVTLLPPSLTGTLPSLRAELLSALEKAGLYPKEAAAMLETWRDSWFEDGTRLFYIVPPKAVDGILPLRITPAPSAVTRVFVGRMEVVTPTIETAVERAIATNDLATLQRYGRFLGPITDRILARTSDGSATRRIRAATEDAYTAYVKRASVCE
jgi:hypothetical protein